MATHASILAWEITWAEDPDGLQSMGSQRIRPHPETEHTHTHTHTHLGWNLKNSVILL